MKKPRRKAKKLARKELDKQRTLELAKARAEKNAVRETPIVGTVVKLPPRKPRTSFGTLVDELNRRSRLEIAADRFAA